ncbi:hypothetical protein GGI07_000741 [Coemansia sp. Benny D115]|nr:hypothetical protein GGI07_000741 [Coemansia sp. Benny D115]
MTFAATSSLSYPTHISRRRSSVASTTSVGREDSAPSSPLAQAPRSLLPLSSVSAIRYTYVCEDCGFGTDLLGAYMPHIANPCGQPVPNTWGKL